MIHWILEWRYGLGPIIILYVIYWWKENHVA